MCFYNKYRCTTVCPNLLVRGDVLPVWNRDNALYPWKPVQKSIYESFPCQTRLPKIMHSEWFKSFKDLKKKNYNRNALPYMYTKLTTHLAYTIALLPKSRYQNKITFFCSDKNNENIIRTIYDIIQLVPT